MTWTYSGDPAATPRDAIRFLLGDTDATDPLVTDEEISYAHGLETHPYSAAAFLAERLGAQFARDERFSVDGVSLGGDRSKRFFELAATLRQRAAENPPATAEPSAASVVIATGLRLSDMAAVDALGDRPKPSFIRQDEAAASYPSLRRISDRWYE